MFTGVHNFRTKDAVPHEGLTTDIFTAGVISRPCPSFGMTCCSNARCLGNAGVYINGRPDSAMLRAKVGSAFSFRRLFGLLFRFFEYRMHIGPSSGPLMCCAAG